MVIVAALIGLACLAVYSGVDAFGFVNWDDPLYITENAVVKTGLSWHTIWWAVATARSPYWHPLTWWSHLTDVSLFGVDPGMFHVVNALLHTGTSVLLFVALHRLTRAKWPSAVVALLFAVHPLHVESVAWITERKDVLSGFFWMLSLWAYARYAEKPGGGRYAQLLACYAAAAMAKPMVVTLPVVLMLIDGWPLQRGWRFVEKLPLLAISVIVSVVTFVTQSDVGAVAGTGVLGIGPRVANALVSYVRYLGKMFWPVDLIAFYPLEAWTTVVVVGAVAVLVATTLVAWRLRDAYPYVAWGWAYYLVTLAPVIGLLQAGEQAIADRFMYLPMVGPLVIVVWGARDLAARVLTVSSRRTALAGASAAIIMASAVAARAQAATWLDSVALWQHALAVDPDNYIAHEKLGAAYRDLGRVADARASFERARVAAPPASPRFLGIVDNLIGMTYLSEGRLGEARAMFESAVQENPRLGEAQGNLGNALAASGRPAEAIPHFDEAIRLQPDAVEPRIGRGGALNQTGQFAAAAEEFRRVLALDPNLAEAHNGLGSALALGGDAAGAESAYRTAIRLKPSLATAHFNLAVLFARAGKIAEARAALERALAADPAYAQARQLLDALPK